MALAVPSVQGGSTARGRVARLASSVVLSAVLGAVGGQVRSAAAVQPAATTPPGPSDALNFRDLLRAVPGNDEFDAFWRWNDAEEIPGGIRIPSAIGGKSIDLLTPQAMRERHPSDPALNDTQAIIIRSDIDHYLTHTQVTHLESLGVVFRKPLTAFAARAYAESLLLHEVTHAVGDEPLATYRAGKRRPGVGGSGEFAAHRAHYDHLEAVGVVEPVSNEAVLRHVLRYFNPGTLAQETLFAFQGEFDVRMKSFLPGGEDFLRVVGEQLTRSLRDVREGRRMQTDFERLVEGGVGASPWSTEYGQRYLRGVRDYFLFVDLNRRQETPDFDAAKDIDAATVYGEQQLEKFRRFMGIDTKP
ncbi:MAG: hypothetical protein ACKVPX_18250 [Myxococcaceae bacterium]